MAEDLWQASYAACPRKRTLHVVKAGQEALITVRTLLHVRLPCVIVQAVDSANRPTNMPRQPTPCLSAASVGDPVLPYLSHIDDRALVPEHLWLRARRPGDVTTATVNLGRPAAAAACGANQSGAGAGANTVHLEAGGDPAAVLSAPLLSRDQLQWVLEVLTREPEPPSEGGSRGAAQQQSGYFMPLSSAVRHFGELSWGNSWPLPSCHNTPRCVPCLTPAYLLPSLAAHRT